MKKILIISNCSFSESEANGKTLKNYFIKYNSNYIAQFCINISNDMKYDICNNYFNVRDKDVFKSFLFHKPIVTGKIRNMDYEVKTSNNAKKKNLKLKRNSLTMLIRNFLWKKKRWCDKELFNWIEEFKPDCLLLQAGDLPFFLDFVIELSEKYNIPYYMYTTENYYFKEYSYFNKGKVSIFFPMFHKELKKSYKRFMRNVSGCIYNIDELREIYNHEFDMSNSITVMCSSNKFNNVNNKNIGISDNLKITYAGNLGVGRHKSLIEIAKCLYEINSNYKLLIYGKINDREIEDELKKEQNIEYKGFICYNELKKILQDSDLLIHTESIDKYYIEDLKYAFSTKIADSLACGVPLFFYGSDKISCSKYLKENNCAFVANNKLVLKQVLQEALEDTNKREIIVKNAQNISSNNHNLELNSERFLKFINGDVI